MGANRKLPRVADEIEEKVVPHRVGLIFDSQARNLVCINMFDVTSVVTSTGKLNSLLVESWWRTPLGS